MLIELPLFDAVTWICLIWGIAFVAFLLKRKYIEKEEDEYKRKLKEKVFWLNLAYIIALLLLVFWVRQELSKSCYGYCMVEVCQKYCSELMMNTSHIIVR